ncbi:MAG: serine/threonine-protein kinase, partial [Acidobacteriota bacterium]
MMRQDPRRIHEIFQRAIELSAKERRAFLDRACAGNTGGRYRVERLLAASRSPLPWLEGAVFEAVPDLFDGEQPAPSEGRRLESDRLPQGGRLGPFELLRELGRGGMGVVYEARRADDQYDQRVAIKLIRGELATPREARRLRQERQILASLEHPHIARLLAGDVTPEGLPYLVMEYVEGEPLEAWCRRVEASLEVRIELFRQVCLAVQYAHRHLVVHCDLKPGNVLVTADGVPKLLDFGIARLLDHDFVPRLATTIVSGGRMTPQFASPEQARGERLTAASDIYSLGVMLYRLLTGCPPYRLDGASAYEMQRIVCEKEPEAPSVVANRSLTEQATDASRPPGNLRRRLAGDLDNIVAMTLRKEPERRYASAQQLSEDLRRHLAGLP